jgi:hypothetical protein
MFRDRNVLIVCSVMPYCPVVIRRRFGGTYCFHLQDYFHSLLLDHENEDSKFFRNVGELLPDYTAPYPRRCSSC